MEDRLTHANAGQRLGLAALATIIVITVAWWLLAFWPDSASPLWLARTRAACFGTTEHGLPNAGGWILLIGQPVSMLGFLHVVWGSQVAGGLRALARGVLGRSMLVLVPALLVVGLLGVAWRVAGARVRFAEDASPARAMLTRLDRAAPPLELVDQHGDVFHLDRVRGRPVVLAFAWAHCETVCPLVIQDVLAARAQVPEQQAQIVLITLDPWRDTPRRLPSIARQWKLGADDYVLGGDVETVLNTLKAWEVPIRRDPQTGSIDHPASVYILDRTGRIAWFATGGADRIAALLRRV